MNGIGNVCFPVFPPRVWACHNRLCYMSTCSDVMEVSRKFRQLFMAGVASNNKILRKHCFQVQQFGSISINNGTDIACQARDVGLIPESGRSSGEGQPSRILAWRIPPEKPGGLQYMGSQSIRHN